MNAKIFLFASLLIHNEINHRESHRSKMRERRQAAANPPKEKDRESTTKSNETVSKVASDANACKFIQEYAPYDIISVSVSESVSKSESKSESNIKSSSTSRVRVCVAKKFADINYFSELCICLNLIIMKFQDASWHLGEYQPKT